MNQRHRRIILLFFFVWLIALGTSLAVPVSNHVVVVIEENHSYSSVINSSSMPYLKYLAGKYGLAINYYGNTHPSIGNYFMLTTGQIITNDDGYTGTVTANNVVRELLSAGKTWRSYAESLPYSGYIGGDSYPYSKHHNPMAYFSDVRNSSMERQNLVSFSHFASDVNNGNLPDLSFVIPNQLHNGHDGSLSTADQWLKTNIAPLLANPAFQKDGILFITFDESNTSDTAFGGGHVATVVIGPRVIPGIKSPVFFQHQSMLRTIEFALGIPTIGAAQKCCSMGGMFH